MRGNLPSIETLLKHMQDRQTGRHVKNSVKEMQLASRSIIDSVIDTLEEQQETPKARKINITSE